MNLTKFQKNVLTFIGVAGIFGGIYYINKKRNNPPTITTEPIGEGEKLVSFLYDYFSDFFQWGIALDEGAYIKSYVDQFLNLDPVQLQRASDYYRKYYANVTGEPTLSSWLDDQYYTLGIFPDPFDSAIIYLENLGY